MKHGINVGQEFVIECKHCRENFDIVQAKRRTKRTDPIRCPRCGCIVAK